MERVQSQGKEQKASLQQNPSEANGWNTPTRSCCFITALIVNPFALGIRNTLCCIAKNCSLNPASGKSNRTLMLAYGMGWTLLNKESWKYNYLYWNYGPWFSPYNKQSSQKPPEKACSQISPSATSINHLAKQMWNSCFMDIYFSCQNSCNCNFSRDLNGTMAWFQMQLPMSQRVSFPIPILSKKRFPESPGSHNNHLLQLSWPKQW